MLRRKPTLRRNSNQIFCLTLFVLNLCFFRFLFILFSLVVDHYLLWLIDLGCFFFQLLLNDLGYYESGCERRRIGIVCLLASVFFSLFFELYCVFLIECYLFLGSPFVLLFALLICTLHAFQQLELSEFNELLLLFLQLTFD